MVLADTSVWVDHFRRGSPRLSALLDLGEVLCHPFVIGELACGNLRRRAEPLALLQALPSAQRATDEEVLAFIERHRLHGRGLGLVDMHLLASCALARALLWTADRRLRKAADDLGLGAS
jgi:predicted nucleic acid-binding protein